jgi:hypothetical protein
MRRTQTHPIGRLSSPTGHVNPGPKDVSSNGQRCCDAAGLEHNLLAVVHPLGVFHDISLAL